MRIPLRFQVTEYDCGTASLVNAISYLYDREDIPPELIKSIYNYTLDRFDKSGHIGEGGTSLVSIELISHWLNEYSNTHEFKIETQYIEKEKVSIENIQEVLKKGGVLVVRLHYDCLHYVLLTGMDEDNVYIFCPYYVPSEQFTGDKEVTVITDKGTKYNRSVSKKRFFSTVKNTYSMGPINERAALVMRK